MVTQLPETAVEGFALVRTGAPAAGRTTPSRGLVVLLRATIRSVAENKVATVLIYFGWIFVKVLAASHGSLTTALGILSASSLPLIVAGATLSFLPVLVLDIVGVFVYLLVAGYWRGRWLPDGAPRSWRGRTAGLFARNAGLFLTVFVLAVAVAVLPSEVMLVLTLALAVAAGSYVRWRRSRPSTPAARPRPRPADDWHSVIQRLRDAHVFAGAVGLLLTLFVFIDVPQISKTVWEPHEVLYRSGSNQVLDVGYVLNDSGDTIVVLRTHSRDLHIYEKAVVGRRQICAVGDSYWHIAYWGNSLFQSVFHLSHVPTCPAVPKRGRSA